MNEYGIHCYYPTDKAVVLIYAISRNKQGFSKRKVNGAEQAKTLYVKLGYPSVKDFRWVVQSQQIIDCPVTVQDTGIAYEIWVKHCGFKRLYH